MASSSSSLAVFAISGAIATAVVAIAMRRMRARREEAPAPTEGAAPRNAAPIAILAAAVAGLLAMGLGFYAFFNDTAPSSAMAIDTVVAGASRAELARHLERAPNDGRAWVLLARIDFAADHFADAAAEYDRALAVSPKVALDPGVWCEYADALGMAQGGSLAGRPRELVMRALAHNPAHPRALEMAGSAAYEAGEYRAAGEYWRQLLPQLADESRARRELAAAIARADDKLIPADPPSGAPAPGK